MAFNFIIPNLFKHSQMKGLAALGVTVVRFDEMHQEFEALANTDAQKLMVESLYGGVIPQELPICVLSERDGNMLSRKYGLPETQPGSTVAAIGLGLDTNHHQVLLLTEEYLDHTAVVRHELIHYRQVKDGLLRYTEDGTARWSKPGEEYTINCAQDLVKKHSLKTFEELMWHELHKPWELEAYALTSDLSMFSTRCLRLVHKYLKTH